MGALMIFYLSYSIPTIRATINYALTPDQNYGGELKNVLIRLCGFGITTFMTFGFIVTCYIAKPLSKPLFLVSDTGRNSISVYYIHGFVALYVTTIIGELSILYQLIIASALTFGLCWLLSCDRTVRLLKPLFDFSYTPIFVRKIICGTV